MYRRCTRNRVSNCISLCKCFAAFSRYLYFVSPLFQRYLSRTFLRRCIVGKIGRCTIYCQRNIFLRDMGNSKGQTIVGCADFGVTGKIDYGRITRRGSTFIFIVCVRHPLPITGAIVAFVTAGFYPNSHDALVLVFTGSGKYSRQTGKAFEFLCLVIVVFQHYVGQVFCAVCRNGFLVGSKNCTYFR